MGLSPRDWEGGGNSSWGGGNDSQTTDDPLGIFLKSW